MTRPLIPLVWKILNESLMLAVVAFAVSFAIPIGASKRAVAMGAEKITIEDVSLEDLKRGLKNKSIILIDVREKEEWDAGHIPGALFNPLSSFKPTAIPTPAPGQRIVLQCRSGRRSVAAWEIAQSAGRTDVRAHFSGGMIAWRAADEPIEK